MARPSKASKEKAAAVIGVSTSNALTMPPNVIPTSAGGPRPPVIDVDNFIRVRDSVYGRLTTIQQLIKSFSDDYLRQTNLLLGLSTPEDGSEDALANLEASMSALSGVSTLILPPPPVVEEKKERKKRTHDPNAPKRPLTPYFLYMQTARPIIANDLGPEAPKRAVQEEGQRRWASMVPSEKGMWNQAYQYNLRLYNARVHSYKHGNPDAKDMDDDEANKYANNNNIQIPNAEAAEQNAMAEQLQAAAAASSGMDAQGEDDGDLAAAAAMGGVIAPGHAHAAHGHPHVHGHPGHPGMPSAAAGVVTPAKTKKPVATGRKRKSATDGDEMAAAMSLAMADSPVLVAGAPTPDKKRRRTSGKPNEDKEEPKKAGRKKNVKA
ncbi:hypothetical protein Cpir12675_001204 [Ceratocystis pirilliformis]|uniref:HMG box domain-containing protein n=1 Tax=Ceratocystis pirilliformis TaxID=259994 RepID=A0ABR3ZH00_9PEZI